MFTTRNIFATSLVALLLTSPYAAQGALYIVGNATLTNWNRQEMTQVGTGEYQWQGYLARGGELKFMTSPTGWDTHYGPTTAGTLLTRGTQTIAQHTSGDYKFWCDVEGYCTVTVNTTRRTLSVADQDGVMPVVYTYPETLYPTGTAVPTAWDENSSYQLQQTGPDNGVYQGRLYLNEGTLAFHAKPYHVARPVLPIKARLAAKATARTPQLYMAITCDKCAYQPGETATFTVSTSIPTGTHVRYRHLGDIVQDTLLTSKKWSWRVPQADFKGYMVELYTSDGAEEQIIGTIALDVSSDWTRFPRYGFVATFGSDKTSAKTRTEMTWLNRCHINGVQFQDWHFCHDQPLAGTAEKPSTTYRDIANRTISLSAVRAYIRNQHTFGMKSIFYNLLYGACDGYADRGVREEWFIFKDKAHSQKDSHDLPSSWKSDIYLVNPAHPEWLEYMAQRNDDVYWALDFDGFQIDQLGYRGTRYDYSGQEVDLPGTYPTFIQAMKARHPSKRLIMNAVGGYGQSGIAATGKMDMLYNEVWGNHDYDALTTGEAQYTNLKNVIDENMKFNPMLRTCFAAYMNYLADGRTFNTPGVVMTDAVMFALGGSHLELGGDHMLCREYFPYAGMKWSDEMEDWMTRYYDFLTAYENVLRGAWSELGAVGASSPSFTINKWAPVSRQVTLLAREVEGRKVVHLLNFTHEESASLPDEQYMLCWHDNKAVRPWPLTYDDVTVTITGLTGLNNIRKVWVASPDYCGGAVQEITNYTKTGTRLTLTLPHLNFWTMIVIEPTTATTADNLMYGPAQSGASITSEGEHSLVKTTLSTRAFDVAISGVYDATVDIQQGLLTLSADTENAIRVPFSAASSERDASRLLRPFYTLQGTRATAATRGIVIQGGRKELR